MQLIKLNNSIKNICYNVITLKERVRQMAQNKYLWDIEQLQTLSNNLNQQLEVLKSNKEFLNKVDTNIKNCWTGMSASTFYQKIDFDIETFEKVVSYLEKQTSYLNKAITECYTKCENDIKSKLQSLSSNV